MLKIIMKTAVLVLTIALCFSLAAFAEENLSMVLQYDAESGEIKLSGSCSGDVLVIIPPAGMSDAQLSSGEVSPCFVRRFKAENGYSISVMLPDTAASGKYFIYVSSGEKQLEESIQYVNSTLSGDVVTRLNEAESKAEYTEVLENNPTDIGVDAEDKRYIEGKDDIFDIMYGVRREYTSAAQINTDYNMAYALYAINNGSFDDFEEILQKYQRQLKINFESDYADDERINADAKLKLFGLLKAINYEEALARQPFNEILEEYKSVAAVSAASDTGWTEIKKAITQSFASRYSNLTDSSTYKALKNKDGVFQIMMNDNFGSVSDVEKSFETAAAALHKKQLSQNGSTSGGGSSSSGSSGAGTANSITTPAVISEIVKNPGAAEQKSFSDVEKEHWGYEAISAMAGKGVIQGYEDGTFKPDNFVTRAEFAAMMVNAFNIALSQNDESVFSDVASSDWYAKAVSAAANAEIVSGYDKKFYPLENITRQDAALIIYRAVTKHENLSGIYIFDDRSEISDYARDAVMALGARKIVSGVGQNKFEPASFITRAQAVQIICNALEIV